MLEEGISSKNWQHFTHCLFSCIVLSPCPRWVKLAPSKSNVTLMWSRKIPAKSYFDPSMESKLPLELKRPFRGVETTLFPKGRKWPLGVKTTLLNLQSMNGEVRVLLIDGHANRWHIFKNVFQEGHLFARNEGFLSRHRFCWPVKRS
jgi:hypothetical protein